MDFGLTMPTHGLLMRDERDFYLQKLAAAEMRPVEVAQLAERARLPLGVVLRPRLHGPRRGRVPHGEHLGHARLSEPPDDARHDRDDGRDRRRDEHHPHGVVGLDRALSPPARRGAPARDGRRALGRPPDRRRRAAAGIRRSSPPSAATSSTAAPSPRSRSRSSSTPGASRTSTSAAASTRSTDVSLEPKPVQKPHPPIVFGAVTDVGARRAARTCDGIYPMFLDSYGDPGRFEHLREAVLREAERIERDVSDFRMYAFCSGPGGRARRRGGAALAAHDPDRGARPGARRHRALRRVPATRT